jgi:hypothetical protein
MVWGIGGTDLLREKPVLVPLCPSQISNTLAWDKTRTYVVRGWQLTNGAMMGLLATMINLIKRSVPSAQ